MLRRMLRMVALLGIAGICGLIPIGGRGAAAQDLVIGLQGSITSMDPHFHALGPNNNVAAHVFDRLLHQDEKQRLIPGLATEWKPIDELTWEFRLRRGVKFHDGSEFDAQDVIATFKRVPWVPNSPSSFTGFVRPIVEAVAVDPHTLRFKTAVPAPLLPVMLSAVNIVNRKAVEAPTADFNSGKAAIGTGPFRLVEFVPSDRVVLARNDAYWGVRPAWTKVTLKLIPNNAARTAALLAGDVQMIEAVPSADLPRLRANKDLALHRVTSSRVIYLAFDQARF